MTLGQYDYFKVEKIQLLETFNSTFSSKQLQQKLIKILFEINQKEFSFEEVADPTVPDGKVIFEFGLADGATFNFVDEEEVGRVLDFLEKQRLPMLDFFCAVRYYKGSGEKKSALKFDYYMLRTGFGKDTLEVMVFQERGPRYVSPKDLVNLMVNKVNEGSAKKIIKKN